MSVIVPITVVIVLCLDEVSSKAFYIVKQDWILSNYRFVVDTIIQSDRVEMFGLCNIYFNLPVELLTILQCKSKNLNTEGIRIQKILCL